MTQRSVLVVGGGIAGLTVANAFADTGHLVDVVEVEPTWPAIGWGLSLTGPALRALDRLGVADECIAAGYAINQVYNCGPDSEPFSVQTMPKLIGDDRAAQAGIPRPVLREILRTRAAAKGVNLRSGLTVETLTEQADGVVVELTDGTGGRYDLVIGADGVGSATRSAIGLPATPQYNGQMVWRARVPRPDWGDILNTFAGEGNHAGMIPITQQEAYIFHTENAAEPYSIPREELADRMRARLSGFTGRFADLCAKIVDPDLVVRRPVQVLMAEPPWHRGHVVLIGDAAHTPSPQMISGAALAIEDALVLADLIGPADGEYPKGGLPGLLDQFAARRYDRCALVVSASIQMSELEREGRHPEAHQVQGRTFGALAAPM
jgi:2-polyprenyl-6-methoxyphenol hydroxylase-like FAD-dependent oxidoreductase